jgi:hypothetical protein
LRLFQNPVGFETTSWKSGQMPTFPCKSKAAVPKTEGLEQLHLKKIVHSLILKIWRNFMESMIIDRKILPEPIFSYIHSEKIKIFEENGNIILAPVKRKPDVNDLFGMFNDGKLSSEDFIKQKAVEKAMEN